MFCRSHILFLGGVFLKDCDNCSEKEVPIDFKNFQTEILLSDDDNFGDNENEIDQIDQIQNKLHSAFIERSEIEGIVSTVPENIHETDMNSICDSSYECFMHDKIPKYFYDKESWVQSTSLKCWSCDLRFATFPLFIPLGLQKIVKGNKEVQAIRVYGNFCSTNCASYYIRFIKDDKIGYEQNQIWERLELLKLIHFKFYGKKINEISPSPSKTCMTQYGGNKTAEQYYKLISELN